MNALERKLVSYGIGGCPLVDVPADVAHDALASDIAEVVPAKDVQDLMENFSTNDLKNCFKGDISRLKNKRDYVLRIKTNEWRRLVLRSKTRRSKAFYIITSLLVTNPDGLSKNDLKKNVGRSSKKWGAWIQPLIEDSIISCRVEDGQVHYTYNFQKFEEEKLEKTAGEEAQGGHAVATSQKEKTGLEQKRVKSDKTESGERASGLTKSFGQDLYAKAFDMLRSEDGSMSLDGLRQRLEISPNASYSIFLAELQKLFPVQIVSDDQGGKRAVLAESDMKKRMIEFGERVKIMILSDHRSEMSEIDPGAFSCKDSSIVDFFEENGFCVMEIRSKYIPPEFIIHLPSISRDDDVFKEFVQNAKTKVAGLFRERIKSIFYQNSYFAVFDNGFSPELERRVRLFHAFICGQMKDNGFQVVFDKEMLHKMEFLVFAACVPLGFENLVLEIAVQHAEGSGDHQGFDLDRAKSCIRSGDSCDYEALYERSRKVLCGVTCGRILGHGNHAKAPIAYLRSKLCIREFDKIFSAVLRYNMFEAFESESFLYFQVIDGAGDRIEKIFSEVKNETNDKYSVSISHADRKMFFDKICELPQEEFVDKAKELLKTSFGSAARRYYLQKLRLFK